MASGREDEQATVLQCGQQRFHASRRQLLEEETDGVNGEKEKRTTSTEKDTQVGGVETRVAAARADNGERRCATRVSSRLCGCMPRRVEAIPASGAAWQDREEGTRTGQGGHG